MSVKKQAFVVTEHVKTQKVVSSVNALLDFTMGQTLSVLVSQRHRTLRFKNKF